MSETEAVSRRASAQTQPECALAAAVIEQAVRDLKEPTDPYGGDKNKPRLQSEAISFFTGGGEWAQSRHLWFTAIGLDEVAVFEVLKPWLQGRKLRPYRPPAKPEPEPAPEPPKRKRIEPVLNPSLQRVVSLGKSTRATLAVIPRKDVFRPEHIFALRPDEKEENIRYHLDRLVESDYIAPLRNGYLMFVPQRIDPTPRPDRQRTFLALKPQVAETLALVPEHDKFSAADIYPKRPELSEPTVRNHLVRLVETGHLRQLPRGHYLKLRLQQTAAE